MNIYDTTFTLSQVQTISAIILSILGIGWIYFVYSDDGEVPILKTIVPTNAVEVYQMIRIKSIPAYWSGAEVEAMMNRVEITQVNMNISVLFGIPNLRESLAEIHADKSYSCVMERFKEGNVHGGYNVENLILDAMIDTIGNLVARKWNLAVINGDDT
ncbi:hypothetical protein GLOIN_2v1790671 [Rhizophagus clarus]|uniref:Uncharacterized protein n=1 Tax=Rhizophagus clarus TaxID=94130 RepID=A0A8H3M2Y1_9GLOM|nr:hypothetical protein GLOIN_2v1790671 [Rhizophagus clarus]